MSPERPANIDRDLPLPPGEYVLVQDTTKGPIKVYVGPVVLNQTGQEQAVIYDPNTRTFRPTDLHSARRQCVFVPEDAYVTLSNPAFDVNGQLRFPQPSACSPQVDLKYGERVKIPGPINFALWPEQTAFVLPRHRLRSNQYLLVEVIDGAKAQENWKDASIEAPATAPNSDPSKIIKKTGLKTGSLLIIKGTEAEYFIPCTGIEVIPTDKGEYVRDAMTLEQLEFCILVDENGEKRYEHGPQVVFPRPTEEFWQDAEGNKKFRAYELSKISGLYIKVIDDYTEGTGENAVKHVAGEELFITGDKNPIYFPRPEHAIVKYGDHDMHFATAIPKGEGRYVLDRTTGKIKTEVGEQMLLPDPRTHVIVRRILSERECNLWFPGNANVRQHNLNLRAAAGDRRAGFLEDDAATLASAEGGYSSQMMGVSVARALRTQAGRPVSAETLARSTVYTPPRTISLDTKMDGAVCIQVWTGYAVMVVSKDGERHAVLGPDTVLLNYDETLEVLRMSTGKPKNTDKMYETVYLNVSNNKVSDVVRVVTQDQVGVDIKVSYHVNFVGDPQKWFNVQNYVKLLCDRVRSILKGVVRKQKIEDFFENHVALIRDTVLGPHDAELHERKGMIFEANGMHVVDVDVLEFTIPDATVSNELLAAQRSALTSSLRLQNRARDVDLTQHEERLMRQVLEARAETAHMKMQLSLADAKDERELAAARLETARAEEAGRLELTTLQQEIEDLKHSAALRREAATDEQAHNRAIRRNECELEHMEAETKATRERLAAMSEKLVAALEANSRGQAMKVLAESGMRISNLSGTDFMETLKKALGPAWAQWFANVTDETFDGSLGARTLAGTNSH